MIGEMKVSSFSRAGLPALLAAVMLLGTACPVIDSEEELEKERIKADTDYKVKDYLRSQYMDVFYYWRDQVIRRNSGLKPYNYDIYTFFDEMLYSGDRWSWMCDKEDYVSEETGVMQGTWGVSVGQAVEYYGDYTIRIRYIYPGSPFEKYGVTRGSAIIEIGGKNIEDDEEGFTSEKLQSFQSGFYKSPQTFKIRRPDGSEVSFTDSMEPRLSTKSSLSDTIFRPEDFSGLPGPVGYFHYLSFKANFLSDIDSAMKKFHDAGVRNLIVDLRYNGGGDSRASQLLVDYLAPKSAVGKPYVLRKHNSYLASLSDDFSDAKNTYSIEGNAGSLTLDKLYFIVGEGSASASEMVINGLKPYFGDRLQMVGDTTYGKPNGMYVLMYPGSNDDYTAYNKGDFSKLQWVFLPVCFFNQNSTGQQIPSNGFVPDLYRPDDLYHDFGTEEGGINACLTHIATGKYPELIPGTVHQRTNTKSGTKAGYRIKTETDKANYGLDVVQRPILEILQKNQREF